MRNVKTSDASVDVSSISFFLFLPNSRRLPPNSKAFVFATSFNRPLVFRDGVLMGSASTLHAGGYKFVIAGKRAQVAASDVVIAKMKAGGFSAISHFEVMFSVLYVWACK